MDVEFAHIGKGIEGSEESRKFIVANRGNNVLVSLVRSLIVT
jgi:hypothetical protein